MSKKCKGLYWKASVNTFYSKYKSLEVKFSLRLLKKRSCTCQRCKWIIEEYLKEDVVLCPEKYRAEYFENGFVYTDHTHFMPEDCDFDLYFVAVENERGECVLDPLKSPGYKYLKLRMEVQK